MYVYYGFSVTIRSVSSNIVDFYISGYGSTVFTVDWNDPSHCHTDSPTTVRPIADETGDLYLERGWCDANNVDFTGMPKHPESSAAGQAAAYALLPGRVVHVTATVEVTDEVSGARRHVEVCLHDAVRVSASHTTLKARFGATGTLALEANYARTLGLIDE